MVLSVLAVNRGNGTERIIKELIIYKERRCSPVRKDNVLYVRKSEDSSCLK